MSNFKNKQHFPIKIFLIHSNLTNKLYYFFMFLALIIFFIPQTVSNQNKINTTIKILKTGQVFIYNQENTLINNVSISESLIDTKLYEENIIFQEIKILPDISGVLYLIDNQENSYLLNISYDELIYNNNTVLNIFPKAYFTGLKLLNNFGINLNTGEIIYENFFSSEIIAFTIITFFVQMKNCKNNLLMWELKYTKIIPMQNNNYTLTIDNNFNESEIFYMYKIVFNNDKKIINFSTTDVILLRELILENKVFERKNEKIGDNLFSILNYELNNDIKNKIYKDQKIEKNTVNIFLQIILSVVITVIILRNVFFNDKKIKKKHKAKKKNKNYHSYELSSTFEKLKPISIKYNDDFFIGNIKRVKQIIDNSKKIKKKYYKVHKKSFPNDQVYYHSYEKKIYDSNNKNFVIKRKVKNTSSNDNNLLTLKNILNTSNNKPIIKKTKTKFKTSKNLNNIFSYISMTIRQKHKKRLEIKNYIPSKIYNSELIELFEKYKDINSKSTSELSIYNKINEGKDFYKEIYKIINGNDDENSYSNSDKENDYINSGIVKNSNLAEFDDTGRFQNNFKGVEFVGRGGFGCVFKATHKLDDCVYAVKIIKINIKYNEDFLKMKELQEIKIMKKVVNKNIVRYITCWFEFNFSNSSKKLRALSMDEKFNNNEYNNNNSKKESKKSNKINNFMITPLESIDSDSNEENNFINKENTKKSNKHKSSVIWDDEESESNLESESNEKSESNNIESKNNSENQEESDENDFKLNIEEFESSEDENCLKYDKNYISSSKKNNIYSNIKSESSSSSEKFDENSLKKKLSYDKNNNNNNIYNKNYNNRKNSSDKINDNNKSYPVYFYMQMDYCSGCPLNYYLANRKNIPCKKLTTYMFYQMCNGVEKLHNKKIMHRDLKPGNIFLTEKYKIKIGDFGLALEFKNYEFNNEAGTFLYQSPEQKNGQPYNQKVDIYALGVIFVELVSKFNTEFERRTTLDNLSKGIFPENLVKNKGHEINLVKKMVESNPIKRLNITQLMNDEDFFGLFYEE